MSGARHFSELVIWQLGDELRRRTFAFTSRPRFVRDVKLHAQTEDAVNSLCRNIAEGFGADTHREFARFVRIARRSLNELQDAFTAAGEKGYVTDEDLREPRLLLRRLYPAIAHFLAYLDRTADERNDARRQRPPDELPPDDR